MTRELVDGPTLADKLQLGPLPWEEAVAFTRQAASALAYAHEQKIVHRDICPDNITITPEGLLKLANFALAKAASSPKLTQVGMVIGNLKYISPEQIKGVGDLDGRSDIYSLGMVLYEMLCGRPAFDSESQFELMAAQVNQAPRAPQEVNASVPREIGAVVVKALAKDPAERYQTAAEFDEALVQASDRARSGKGETEPFARPSVVQLTPRMSIEVVPDPVFAAAAPQHPEPALVAENAPNFLAVEEEEDVFSRKNILIGGAAGAFVGAVLMSIWLIMR
jgi:serine/threonine protein kinase